MTDEQERMNRAKRIREMRERTQNGTAREDTENEQNRSAGTENEQNRSAGTENEQSRSDTETTTGPDPDAETDDPNTDTADETVETDETADTESDEAKNEQTADVGTGAIDDRSETAATASDGDGTSEDVSAPLPDAEALDSALDDESEANPTDEAEASEATTTEEKTRVLEFALDGEHYCLDIEYIEEIVKEETITRVPNTPEFVQGVVDLRGQITTILNPKVTLGKENTEADELIVVFDDDAFEDQGYIGWVVDDVRQVSPISESEVNDPPIEAEYINGIIDRDEDEEFVIWARPNLAFEAD